MPRRTNDGIQRLHAQAAQQKQKKPVTPTDMPSLSEPEVFDFQRYCLESYASKLAIGMKGQRYASTPCGKALAEKIAHHLEAGEVLEVCKLRRNSTYNRPPNLNGEIVKLQRKQDCSIFTGSGLF
jgi:hypothetical protein